MKIIAAVLALGLAAVSGAPEQGLMHRRAKPTVCNGYSELCDRGYDKVAYATTHNAYATGDNIAANQNKGVREQLDAGIRGFMLDLQKQDSDPMNSPYLCHSSCTLLNAGKAVDTLKDIKTYMDANSDEVITIFLENAASFSAVDVAQIFKDSGLDKYAFAANTSSEFTWPSLSQMISVDKRLVIFDDRSTDTKAVPWLLLEGDYVVQTSYSVASGTSFNCQPNTQVRPLWVMNHFVYTDYSILNLNFERPAPNKASTVNTRASIVGQANQCGSAGHFPNFVTVDFYDVGDIFPAVADINGVDYKSTTTNTFGEDGSASTTSGAARKCTTALAGMAASAALLLLLA
ncbi:hypothetical protein EV183_001991 [Coemansia sp. RSA 2336]|nr:hypothetical protein EV183_001991 [Coemansia sp. RSA 2336]